MFVLHCKDMEEENFYFFRHFNINLFIIIRYELNRLLSLETLEISKSILFQEKFGMGVQNVKNALYMFIIINFINSN